MRCPTCGGENVDGAKFCGVCGARMVASTVPPVADVAPRVTAETRQVPKQPVAQRSLPPPGASLGESMRVPEAKGARLAKIGIVLALDAALAIAGVVLMTRGSGDGDAVAEGAKPSGGAQPGMGAQLGTGGSGAEPGGGSGTAGAGGGGGGARGGGTTGGGGGTTTGGGRPGPGAATGTGAGTGTAGAGVGSDDDPIGAAAAAAAAAAGKIDAGAGAPDAVIDAGVTEVPAVDAAPAAEVPVDAADGVDAPEAAASAAELASHLARLVVQSSGKMDRCYQNATKALPADQPLAGEVDIGLAVMPTGAVQNVRVTRNTTGSTDLANCVQATAAQWSFPAHAESEPVEFVHVFRFGPRNN